MNDSDGFQVMSNAHPYTGLNPWSAKGLKVLLEGIIPETASHPELPETDPIWLLLRRMWAKNPTERPGVAEVVAEVTALHGLRPTSSYLVSL